MLKTKKQNWPRFRSYRVFDKHPVLDADGKPAMTIRKVRNHDTGKIEEQPAPLLKKVERRPWSSEAAINFIRKHDPQLGRRAAKDDWHMFLIGWVQCRHEMPGTDADIMAIAEDARKVPVSALSAELVKRRAARKAQLLD